MASISDLLVQELLNGRFVGCLGTQNDDGSIHLTAVWYLYEGTSLYVATSARTRKFRNLSAQTSASFMIDSRDPLASRGACFACTVEIVTGDASRDLNARIHSRYLSAEALADSRVGPVFATWDDVTVKLTPKSVFTWDMRVLDREVLGGAISTPGYLLPLER